MRRKRREERATPRRGKERRMVDKTECTGGEVGGEKRRRGRGRNSFFLGISFDPVYHTALDICDLIHTI